MMYNVYYNKHKVKYAGYKGKGPKQVIIRDSRDSKYYVVKGHPNYGQAKKVSQAPSPGKAKEAPQKSNFQRSSAPASKGSGGNKGGGQGGGNSGGGHGKGGGKPK